MNSIVMPLPEKLIEKTKKESGNHLELEPVKETVAKDAIKKEKSKTFTASEMWNRHQRRKSASYMMNRWNLN